MHFELIYLQFPPRTHSLHCASNSDLGYLRENFLRISHLPYKPKHFCSIVIDVISHNSIAGSHYLHLSLDLELNDGVLITKGTLFIQLHFKSMNLCLKEFSHSCFNSSSYQVMKYYSYSFQAHLTMLHSFSLSDIFEILI